MTENTQTAVDTAGGVAPPTPPNGGAQTNADDLETLLAQYATEVQTPPSPPEPPQDVPQIDPGRIARIEQKLFQEEVEKTVKAIVGDMDVPYDLSIAWLDQQARKSPELKAAWERKEIEPRKWQKFERALSEEMRKQFDSLRVDSSATADKEAVAAAVRGASTKVPAEPPPKFGQMSNAQYRKEIYDKYGFDPGV